MIYFERISGGPLKNRSLLGDVKLQLSIFLWLREVQNVFKKIVIEKSEGSFSASGELALSQNDVFHSESSVSVEGGGKKNVIFCPTQEKTQMPNFPIEVAFSNKLSAISGLDEQNFIERV